jgi:hypothetical protein
MGSALRRRKYLGEKQRRGKYRKFKSPLPSYFGTQSSTIEHVQGSIEASWRTDGTLTQG